MRRFAWGFVLGVFLTTRFWRVAIWNWWWQEQ